MDALHASGIAAGVIVLVGAGGRRFAQAHEIVEHPGLEYAGRMERDGIVALDAAELGEQRRAIAAGFQPAAATQPPRQATYDIREFLYSVDRVRTLVRPDVRAARGRPRAAPQRRPASSQDA